VGFVFIFPLHLARHLAIDAILICNSIVSLSLSQTHSPQIQFQYYKFYNGRFLFEISDDFAGAASSERLECCVDDYEGEMMPPLPSPTPGVMTDAQGLIIPKKLTNPCLIDPERQSLHRELMFNQKM
jgi:Protein of unknown function (DUF1151)